MKLKLFGKKDKAVPAAPATPSTPTPPEPEDADRRCRQRSPQLASPVHHFRSASTPASPVIPAGFVARSRSTSRQPTGRHSGPFSAGWLDDSALPADGKLKLRVVVDPVAVPSDDAAWTPPSEPFTIEATAWTPVDEFRAQLAERLGTQGKYSLGCYKVNIPAAAYRQAKAYTSLYGIPVHLNSHFASYRLSDYHQLLRCQANEAASTTDSAPAPAETRVARDMTVGDWWPDGIREGDDSIAVLVRLGPRDDTHKLPLTLLAYMSKPAAERATEPPRQQGNSASSRHHGSVSSRPPLTFEMAWDSDVRQLKTAMLKAEHKDTSHLSRIAIWRVNMSWPEMLNCEAFGGLKDGSMPWPYPPNAAQPLELRDLDAPLTRYFGDGVPDSNMIDLYVWIDPRVKDAGAETPAARANGASVPHFAFPMPARLLGAKPRLIRPSTALTPTTDDEEETSRPASRASDYERSRRRVRPITAPAVVQPNREASASPDVHAFGSRSVASSRREASRSTSRHSGSRSPLAAEPPMLPLSKMNMAMGGLNIDTRRPESIKSAQSSGGSTTASTRNGSISLHTISSYSSDYELLTPEEETCFLDRVPSIKSKAA